MLGGAVRGGLLGEPPDLAALDASGHLSHAVDFRRLYATVLDRWWRLDSERALRAHYEPLEALPA
jgi:uncharacterized protein (DUF1501 family)